MGEASRQQVRTEPQHNQQVEHNEQYDNEAKFEPGKQSRYWTELHWQEDNNQLYERDKQMRSLKDYRCELNKPNNCTLI